VASERLVASSGIELKRAGNSFVQTRSRVYNNLNCLF